VPAARCGRQSLWQGVATVIRDLNYFYAHRKHPNHFLWEHVEDMDRFGDDQLYHEDTAVGLMASLVRSPWLRCDELEAIMVDYVVFWEAFGASKQLQSMGGEKWPSKQARMARALMIDAAVKMRWAYHTLCPSGGVLSPFQIRAALLHAQDAGAAWKSVVFAILDRAVMRDPPTWLVEPA
jgi:hypothetical protein